jgi:glycosyltransferase involved in cell wall biosynthesis
MKKLDRTRFKAYAACATHRDGAVTPTFDLVRSVPEIEIHSVDLGREARGRSRGDKLRSLLSAIKAVAGLIKLTVLIRRNDIAIVHTTDRPRDAFCCVLLSRITRARSVVHLHVGYADWMSRMRKWSIRHADAVIAISDFVKQTVVASGHSESKVHPVLNGIDVRKWNQSRDRSTCRQDYNIPSQSPVILTVCRLFPSKGPGHLIAVLPELVREWPDLRLVIVGGQAEPGYQAQLERLARDAGVERNVIFTGWCPDIEGLMALADVFAMPSLGEPFGLVYLEAMAMSLPVVALASGGTPEVVEHGTTGLLSLPGDDALLTEHLRCLLRSPDLRRSMGSRGRNRVESYFTVDRMTRDIELLYERMLQEGEQREWREDVDAPDPSRGGGGSQTAGVRNPPGDRIHGFACGAESGAQRGLSYRA